MSGTAETFEGWAILELLGHRRLAGWVSEQTVAGSSFLRIDVPGPDYDSERNVFAATQLYSPAALYCLTPTTREMALAVALRNQPAPVQRWELPAAASDSPPDDDEGYD